MIVSKMIGKIFVSVDIPKCPEHYMNITVLFLLLFHNYLPAGK